MRFNTMAFAVAISMAWPACAQTAESATPDAKPKKERKMCRALPGMTGSNMPKMECHTKAEWAVIDRSELDPTSQRVRSATDVGNLGPGVKTQ